LVGYPYHNFQGFSVMSEVKTALTAEIKAEQPGKGKSEPISYAFCIEIAGERNQNVICPFDKQKVRGRMDRGNYGGAEPGDIVKKFPTIPGICFVVNTAKSMIRRFDPLASLDNASLLKRIASLQGDLTGSMGKAEEAKLWTELTEDEIKNFTMWCLRLIDMKLAKVVKGTLPTFKQIRDMPGSFRIGQFDNGQLEGEGIIPNEKYRYRVPAKVGAEAYSDIGNNFDDPVINDDGEFEEYDDE